MNLYIDESGSINNHTPNNKYFVITLIHPTNKDALKRAYKRFVSSNHDDLLALDQDKPHPVTGKIVKKGGKMFQNGKFDVAYFDSSNNSLIQIADVFANLLYSHLQTGGYDEELKKLKDAGILKFTFEFPK